MVPSISYSFIQNTNSRVPTSLSTILSLSSFFSFFSVYYNNKDWTRKKKDKKKKENPPTASLDRKRTIDNT